MTMALNKDDQYRYVHIYDNKGKEGKSITLGIDEMKEMMDIFRHMEDQAIHFRRPLPSLLYPTKTGYMVAVESNSVIEYSHAPLGPKKPDDQIDLSFPTEGNEQISTHPTTTDFSSPQPPQTTANLTAPPPTRTIANFTAPPRTTVNFTAPPPPPPQTTANFTAPPPPQTTVNFTAPPPPQTAEKFTAPSPPQTAENFIAPLPTSAIPPPSPPHNSTNFRLPPLLQTSTNFTAPPPPTPIISSPPQSQTFTAPPPQHTTQNLDIRAPASLQSGAFFINNGGVASTYTPDYITIFDEDFQSSQIQTTLPKYEDISPTKYITETNKEIKRKGSSTKRGKLRKLLSLNCTQSKKARNCGPLEELFEVVD